MRFLSKAKVFVFLFILAGLSSLGCTEKLMTPNISTYGDSIDGVVSLISWIVIPMGVLAMGVIVYLLFRYKKTEDGKAYYVRYGKGLSDYTELDKSNEDQTITDEKTGKKIHLGMKVASVILFFDILVLLLDVVIIYRNVGPWMEIEGNIEKKSDGWVLPAAAGGEIANKDVLEIKAVLRQFEFDFYYPGRDGILNTKDDFKVSHFMHVPVDKKVLVHIAAPINDVLHNLFIKSIRLKQDAIPGRTITRWFQVDKSKVDRIGSVDWNDKILYDKKERQKFFILEKTILGKRKQMVTADSSKKAVLTKEIASKREEIKGLFKKYQLEKRLHEIACAELCGPDHSVMNAWMVVDSQEQFNDWYTSHLK